MFIGAVGTGKTTLTQKIEGKELSYHKTQAIESGSCVVDTPGEFAQRRQFYSALQVTSNSVDYIGLLQSIEEKFDTFPPAFGSMFSKPVIGIITKVDKGSNQEQLERAKTALIQSGAKKIFEVSSVEDKGIDELVAFLDDEEE